MSGNSQAEPSILSADFSRLGEQVAERQYLIQENPRSQKNTGQLELDAAF